MNYKQLLELEGYINLWEVLPEDKHSKIANIIWEALDEANKFCTWGDGDSLDRERVRDILLEEYNYKFVGE